MEFGAMKINISVYRRYEGSKCSAELQVEGDKTYRRGFIRRGGEGNSFSTLFDSKHHVNTDTRFVGERENVTCVEPQLSFLRIPFSYDSPRGCHRKIPRPSSLRWVPFSSSRVSDISGRYHRIWMFWMEVPIS